MMMKIISRRRVVMLPRSMENQKNIVFRRSNRREFCNKSLTEKEKKERELRLRQVNYMRNPPTMLKIFNPELYMDPKNSRTWKIVGGAWVVVFTTLGMMYLKERMDGDHDEEKIQKRKKETEAERRRKINEESW